MGNYRILAMESTNEMHCLEVTLKGQVQGVGMRPALFKAAHQSNLTGTISNTGLGSKASLYGKSSEIKQFLDHLSRFLPSHAKVSEKVIKITPCETTFDGLSFEIEKDDNNQRYSIPTDLATCTKCWEEFFDKDDRRHSYPFITCCECGPRWSLIKKLPFEREHTSMDDFPMCHNCHAEYEDPDDRRFFAQTISCPDCGPQLSMEIGDVQARLARGEVGLVKGIGGFAIVGDALDSKVLQRIREIKKRPSKPLAIMVRDKEVFSQLCVNEVFWDKLNSYEAPIRVVKTENSLSTQSLLTPYTDRIGLMAPTSPLHYLLFGKLEYLVFTSGNERGDSIEFDHSQIDHDFLKKFDFVLDHNRVIHQPVDDSVVSTDETLLRAARGYFPKVQDIKNEQGLTLVAHGADMKNSLAFLKGDQIFHTPYISELGSPKSVERLEDIKSSITNLLEIENSVNVSDLHPNYLSSFIADEEGTSLKVQHHLAHAHAAFYESGFSTANVFVCDGTGYGEDGSIWGGEVFSFSNSESEHNGTFERFSIPAGEEVFKSPKLILDCMIGRSQGLVETNSLGRWFDAMAYACFPDELSQLEYEAQAPLFLESKIEPIPWDWPELDFTKKTKLVFPLKELTTLILNSGSSPEQMAWLVHDGLAELMTQAMRKLESNTPVVFTGGVFHNLVLKGRLIARLEGQVEYYFSKICGDHQISLGQVLATVQEGEHA